MDKLDKMDPDLLHMSPAFEVHSIGDILQHIINWRWFVVNKIRNSVSFDIKTNSEDDWLPDSDVKSKTLSNFSMELKETQDQIVMLLSMKKEAFLKQRVPDKDYDFRYLIEGLIQHDMYHLGQVALIERMVKSELKLQKVS